jgi:ankyrin repeat protein
MKFKETFNSAFLVFIFGFISTVFGFSQSDTTLISGFDTTSQEIDTSEYIRGDINFNLILAADKGYDKEVLRLLNEGAFINSRTGDGVTPLMYAVENQHSQVVRILLLNGANPDLKDYYGTPALIPAVKKGNLEIAEMLIRKGADINIRDEKNRTALMYAVSYNDLLIADMLIYYDADVNLTDNEGNTALNIAAYYGYTDIVKLLSEHMAALEKPDNNNFTPLHSSCQNGNEGVVNYLLSQGASTSLYTKAGYTPLALAVKNNHYEVTSSLIENGAGVNEKVAIATSPLNIAKSNKNDSIVDLLVAHGADMFNRPAIQYYSINFDMSISADDFFMGGGFDLHDTRYGLSASLGIATRISAKLVLEDTDIPNTYYQYWERRTYTYLGAYKRLKLFTLDIRSSGGLYAGGRVVYTFGSYRGMNTKPDPRILLSPIAGAYMQFRGFIITLGYEYVNFKTEKVSPNRFMLSMKFLIAGKGIKQPINKKLWLD